MAKTASRIFKALLVLLFVGVIATEFLAGKIPTTDLIYGLFGALLLFVVLPAILYFVQVEPHIAKFRRHLEAGFYKTPAGKIFLVGVAIMIVVLFWLL